ncbi:MAG: hypothetical protein A2W61_03205 [Deltaproteobacteria bacterium RIFCSPLOWO2_01_44_7]|nr:MAG: hypothetical protein A2712_02685 [Deltaproteobacteria bacterium RIFCSPHIGHO2_01_FULL_43_49]OGQ16102.1 MAG: hypothetical protein A3D22_00655 [Deltaproteobacteria bacterium RIFCSPHIGHO2_02_FULL_44_53]OGQ29063.1 MAG: hypothetical protein A3D98_04440 [Deltaproteobacteria bacterium RIFCSPHIGHO2_12_FULL_44_21]OGQ32619.1 MAG: hypothetical protein A2979_08585 [Deltaproteobacteria bacterium RIFCSPLOWO2_01_FULL_45_74]OGQ38361.1 MAG: hypothetical protein A2W61_03205 [Deltaproteobacteria bacterium 
MTSNLIDISIAISPDAVVWPGSPTPEFSLRRSMAKGDSSNNSNFFMNIHTGTHIDAPLHFVKNGMSVDGLPLEIMVGKVLVMDLSGEKEITVAALEERWPAKETKRILIKTTNSKFWKESPRTFRKDYIALTEGPARWLLERQVELIGIDYLSIQRFGDSPLVHKILLQKGIVILEGLDLSSVKPGEYELICLPLKLVGTEGAPVRALLRSMN